MATLNLSANNKSLFIQSHHFGLGLGAGLGGGGEGFLIPSVNIPLVGGGAGRFAMDTPLHSSSDDINRLEVIKEALRHTELRLEDLEKTLPVQSGDLVY
ncbi:MAG: hypothetical protein ABJQ70_07745 [Roseobacter sp.]